MASTTAELPIVRMSCDQRDRADHTGRSLRQLLVQWWPREEARGSSESSSHRGLSHPGRESRDRRQKIRDLIPQSALYILLTTIITRCTATVLWFAYPIPDYVATKTHRRFPPSSWNPLEPNFGAHTSPQFAQVLSHHRRPCRLGPG